jgi:hypothetical protein
MPGIQRSRPLATLSAWSVSAMGDISTPIEPEHFNFAHKKKIRSGGSDFTGFAALPPACCRPYPDHQQSL